MTGGGHDPAASWTGRAERLRERGEWDRALDACRRAAAIDPQDADAWILAATSMTRLGWPAAGAAAVAVRLAPGIGAAWGALAVALAVAGRPDAARHAFHRALAAMPALADAWANLAILLSAAGHPSAGRAASAALALRPELASQPRLAAAAVQAGAVRVGDADAVRLTGRAEALLADGELDGAATVARAALALDPAGTRAQVALGRAAVQQGRREDAVRAYGRALRRDPSSAAARIGRCMAQLPVVYRSEEEIGERRAAYARELEALHARWTDASDAERAEAARALGSSLPFFLAYQGCDDRDLQRLYGDLAHCLASARRPDLARRPDTPPADAGEPIRVGFLSAYFHHHSVWKIPLRGWLEGLPADRFALYGYQTTPRRDGETAIAERLCRRFVRGPLPVDAWAEAIRRDRLHVLVVPEVGMDPTTAVLSAFRLAPVQLAGPGHPVTTGLPTMDGFLSCDLMEPPGAERHYTEPLIRLPNLGVSYTSIVQPEQVVDRGEFGIDGGDVAYWCCQTLFKYLPRHDDLFARIAEKVPRARFLFIAYGQEDAVTGVFARRIGAAFARRGLSFERHCRFLAPMSPARFSAVARACDVFLDNPGWSGNNTAMESLAFGLPVVTWPGPLMRMRHSAAILSHLGVAETVADSADAYVDIAARLGTEPTWRRALARRLLDAHGRLYNDPAPAAALADILVRAARAGRLD